MHKDTTMNKLINEMSFVIAIKVSFGVLNSLYMIFIILCTRDINVCTLKLYLLCPIHRFKMQDHILRKHKGRNCYEHIDPWNEPQNNA